MISGLYAKLTADLGYTYHTAELRSVEEARKVWKVVNEYAKS